MNNTSNKQTVRGLHFEGWWDHMPAGHHRDVLFSPNGETTLVYESGARPVSHKPEARVRPFTEPRVRARTIVMNDSAAPVIAMPTPTPTPRRIRRSHATAWILVAAVGATGGALAVAHMHDPETIGEHLDSALAEMKSLTGPSSISTTAQTATPAPTEVAAVAPAQDPAPATTAMANIPDPTLSSDTPLPTISPAAGRSVIHAAPDAAIKQAAVAVKQPEPRQLVTLAPSQTKELSASPQMVPTVPEPIQMTPVEPVQPVQPIQPPPVVQPPVTQPPMTQPPVVLPPPLVQPPLDTVPPVTPPASSPTE